MENKIVIRIEPDSEKLRIDKFLKNNFKKYSRSFFQKLILEGKIKVNDKPIMNSYKLKIGDELAIELPADIKKIKLGKQKIKLDIVFENKDIAVINKPSGMVVHPSDNGQHLEKTLVNALLYHFGKENLSDFGGNLRPGIVHRLDKDTSGLIIVAKNNKIHQYLVGLMKKRSIEKRYIALLVGFLEDKRGLIDSPLKKDQNNWGKMNLATEGEGREAKTEFEVKNHYEIENYKFTLVEARILTGRTHQIRVHFASIGFPVAGDFLYGNKKINQFMEKYGLKRQFLHAEELKFSIPDGEIIEVKKELPADLQEVLDNLDFLE